MSTLTVPLVNLNGTSKQALLEGYQEAWEKLDEAFVAMQKIEPHGRDYQTTTAIVFERAKAQHIMRLQMLTAVQREIEMLMEEVDKQ